jgi:hypothetical protein
MNSINLSLKSIVQHTYEFEDTKLRDAIEHIENSFYTLEDENKSVLAWSEVTELIEAYKSADITLEQNGEPVGETTTFFKNGLDKERVVRAILWSLGVVSGVFASSSSLNFGFIALAIGVVILAVRKLLRIKFLYVPSEKDLEKEGNWSFIVVGEASIEMFYDSKYEKLEQQIQEAKSLIGLGDTIDDDVIELESYCVVTAPITIELQVDEAFRVIRVSSGLPREVSLTNLSKLNKMLGFSRNFELLGLVFIGIAAAVFIFNL